MKNTKKVLACAVAFSMAFTAMVVPANAAKKATIAKKTVKVKVGKTVKITIKNKAKKAKYKFTSSKKAVATVKANGTVKGVKAGTAKITVKETLKKKTRALGKVTVKVSAATPAANAPAVTQAPAAPVATAPAVTQAPAATATPVPTEVPKFGPVEEGFTRTELALADSEAVGKAADLYDEAAGGVKFEDVSNTNFKLPETLNEGDILTVHMKGIDKGEAGFRCYVTSDLGDTCSDAGSIAKSIGDENADEADEARFKGITKNEDGTFTWDVKFEITAETQGVCIKGITYADNVEDLVITDMAFDIKKNA